MADFFSRFGVEQWLALMSAVLAISSFVLNLRLVARQEKRNATSLKLAYDSNVIDWSDEVLHVLADAHEVLAEKGVSYGDADFPMRRSETRAKLSALIDRGRIFFPNRTDTDHGADKDMGFQGHRQPILSTLVRAYGAIDKGGDGPGPDRVAVDALMVERRKFVAEVFKAVDPVRRGRKIEEITT
ncbi:MAG: hypothetical protein QM773_20460 [Hyphomonadaceae bacterium]